MSPGGHLCASNIGTTSEGMKLGSVIRNASLLGIPGATPRSVPWCSDGDKATQKIDYRQGEPFISDACGSNCGFGIVSYLVAHFFRLPEAY